MKFHINILKDFVKYSFWFFKDTLDILLPRLNEKCIDHLSHPIMNAKIIRLL
jgi:hypothetical protein